MTAHRKNGHIVGIRRIALVAYLITHLSSLLSLPAVAGTATSFAYQGILRDETGKPIGKEQATITFRLYNSNEKSATALWTKELNLAIDTNGLFNAELTGGNPDLAKVIADSEASSLPLYVGLTVKDSAGEISPRQKMIATPLAAYAQNVAKADGDFTVAGTATFNGEVSMKGTESVFKSTNIKNSGALDVSGKTTLNGSTEISGAVKVTGEMTVSDNGKLMIGGAQMSLPVGVIMMWAGSESELPSDCWAICDGKKQYTLNGTTRTVPDLRGRFIVGVGSYTDSEGNTASYDAGDKGGVNKHTLSTDEMPKHTHSTTFGSDYRRELDSYNNSRHYLLNSSGNSDNKSKTSSEAGSSQPHENRPPYYALCYIIKIK